MNFCRPSKYQTPQTLGGFIPLKKHLDYQIQIKPDMLQVSLAIRQERPYLKCLVWSSMNQKAIFLVGEHQQHHFNGLGWFASSSKLPIRMHLCLNVQDVFKLNVLSRKSALLLLSSTRGFDSGRLWTVRFSPQTYSRMLLLGNELYMCTFSERCVVFEVIFDTGRSWVSGKCYAKCSCKR